MHKIKFFILIISSMLLLNIQIKAQNVGISTNGSTPDPSAMLDINSNIGGLLIPRMSTNERNNIPSPAQSLIIYNTTTECFETYVNNTWQTIWCNCSGFNITASANPSSTCYSSVTSVLTASGATTYIWNTGGNTASITVTPHSTTTYTVTGTSATGCTGTAAVTVSVGSPVPCD